MGVILLLYILNENLLRILILINECLNIMLLYEVDVSRTIGKTAILVLGILTAYILVWHSNGDYVDIRA